VSLSYPPPYLRSVLDTRGGDDLPTSVRRAVTQTLEPRLASVKERLRKLFDREFVLEPDVVKNYAFLVEYPKDPGNFPTSLEPILDFIDEFYEGLAYRLEDKGFGNDEMLREAFTEGTE